MKVRIDKARHVGNKYHFRVCIHPDRPLEEQAVEEFTYGDDVSLSVIQSEFLALILNKHEDPTDAILLMEGQTYEV